MEEIIDHNDIDREGIAIALDKKFRAHQGKLGQFLMPKLDIPTNEFPDIISDWEINPEDINWISGKVETTDIFCCSFEMTAEGSFKSLPLKRKIHFSGEMEVSMKDERIDISDLSIQFWHEIPDKNKQD